MHQIIYAITLASVYLLFAMGLSVTWGTINVLNFAHGSIFMSSAFVVHLILQHLSLGLPAMVAIGTATGAALSILVHFVAFEPLRRRSNRRDRELQMLIVGIGLAAVPVALVSKVTEGNPFGLQSDAVTVQTVQVLSVPVTSIQLLIVAVAVVLSVAVGWWLRASRHGLALRAIGLDDATASTMGINRSRLAFAAMAGSGALAGLAGVLLTLNFGALSPDSGASLVLKAFAVIIIGGVGSVLGVVVGSLILATAETLVLSFTGGTWVDAISFSLIFALLLVRPQGLFGRRMVVKT